MRGSPVRDGRERSDAERWERSARFWLRAYPPRWRAARADEVLAVLMDLAAPGARRVGIGAALDLLRGGWATRWREHPPFWTWFTYRWDRRIPARYREWAADDIAGRLYPLRSLMRVVYLVPVVTMQVEQAYSHPESALLPWWAWLSLYAAPFLVVSLAVGERNRERARRLHLSAEAGDPLGPGVFVARPTPRLRVRAHRAAPRVVLALALAGLISTVGALLAPIMLGAVPVDGEPYPQTSEILVVSPRGMALGVALVLVTALGLGLVRARRAAPRLAGALPDRPAQPDRVLTASNRRADVWTAIGLLAVAGDAWLEATGRLVLSLSAIVAVVAWVMLPKMIVLARYRDPLPGLPPLSWSDLVCAAGGATPPVDLPLAVVGPYEGPAVPGAVVEVWPWRAGPAGPPWPPAPA